jgi:hypothetical protein
MGVALTRCLGIEPPPAPVAQPKGWGKLRTAIKLTNAMVTAHASCLSNRVACSVLCSLSDARVHLIGCALLHRILLKFEPMCEMRTTR